MGGLKRSVGALIRWAMEACKLHLLPLTVTADGSGQVAVCLFTSFRDGIAVG